MCVKVSQMNVVQLEVNVLLHWRTPDRSEALPARRCRWAAQTASLQVCHLYEPHHVNAVSLLLPLIGSAPQLAPAVSTCSSPKEFKTRQLIIIRGEPRWHCGTLVWGVKFFCHCRDCFRCQTVLKCESFSSVKYELWRQSCCSSWNRFTADKKALGDKSDRGSAAVWTALQRFEHSWSRVRANN